MIHDTYPELFRLFAGYFNQDWQLDDLTAADVFRRYFQECTVQEIQSALHDLDLLLLEPLDEAALGERVWTDLVLGYDPSTDGLTVREWLEQTRRRIADELATRRPQLH